MGIPLRRGSGISWRAALVWRGNLLAAREAWPTRVAAAVLEPVLWVVALCWGLGRAVGEVRFGEGSIEYGRFVAPGLVAALAFARGLHGTLRAGYERIVRGNTLESVLSTPLTLGDAVLGEVLWGATASLAAATTALAAVPLAGLSLSATWVAVLPVAATAGFLSSSLGLAAAALCRSRESLRTAEVLLSTPMLLFCGALFPLDALPGWALLAARASPLTHAVDLARGAAWGAAPPGAAWSALYVVMAALGLFATSLALVRLRRMR